MPDTTNEQIVAEVLDAWERDAMHGVEWFVSGNDRSHAKVAVETVLAALSAAGRLIPDEREYGVRTVPRNGSSDITPCADRQQADDFAKVWRDYARGYEATVIYRRPAGPWVEVPGE